MLATCKSSAWTTSRSSLGVVHCTGPIVSVDVIIAGDPAKGGHIREALQPD